MSIVGILESAYNPCRAYQELNQGDFYSFDQEKIPFLLIYLLPTRKKCSKRKITLTSISSIACVTQWTSIGL